MRYEYNQTKARPVLNINGEKVNPPPVYDLYYACRHKLPVFLLQKNRVAGTIVHTIRTRNGSVRFKMDRQSKIVPVDLTSQVAHDDLLSGGGDISLSLSKRNVALVWPSDAEDMFKQHDGQPRATITVSSVSEDSEDGVRGRALEEAVARASETPDADGDPTADSLVYPRLEGLVRAFANNELKADEAMREFSLIVDEVKKQDLEWAVAHTPEGKVRDHLKKLLANLASTAAEAAKLPQPASKGSSHKDRDADEVLTPEEQVQEEKARAKSKAKWASKS